MFRWVRGIRGNDEGRGPTLVETLLEAREVAIGTKGQAHTFVLSETGNAIGALHGCLERGDMDEFAGADRARSGEDGASEDDAMDIGMVAKLINGQATWPAGKPKPWMTTAPEPTATQAPALAPSPAPAPTLESAQAATSTEADRLGQALGSMGSSSPMLAQFRCFIVGDEVMGIPNLTGRQNGSTVIISLAEDGSALVNGTRLAVLFADSSGDADRLVFNARDVLRAMTSQASGRAPVYGLTAEQQKSWDYVIGTYMPNMVDTAMGDKPRYMLVDLGTDTIGFFDLDAANRPSNQRAGSCVRTG